MCLLENHGKLPRIKMMGKSDVDIPKFVQSFLEMNFTSFVLVKEDV